jgi:hypothetical protein
MADSTPHSGAPIETLLQERLRFQQWLTKLDGTAGNAPPGVREKVRADYEGRLRAVMDELRTHASTVKGELDRHRETQSALESRQSEAEETLAEAQVRHEVGEYSDEQWQKLSDDTAHTLGEVQGELTKVMGEISRLVEVQALILEAPKPTPKPEPRPAPPIEMLPDPEVAMSSSAGSGMVDPNAAAPVIAAPRFVPKPAVEPRDTPRPRPAVAGPGPRISEPLDDLAFLKSVTTDERKSGARRSGEAPRVDATTMSEPAAAATKSGQANQSKTLKCGECGTLNRATEWYCERCGAELATL